MNSSLPEGFASYALQCTPFDPLVIVGDVDAGELCLALCFLWCGEVLASDKHDDGAPTQPAWKRLQVVRDAGKRILADQWVHAAKQKKGREIAARLPTMQSAAGILSEQGYPQLGYMLQRAVQETEEELQSTLGKPNLLHGSALRCEIVIPVQSISDLIRSLRAGCTYVLCSQNEALATGAIAIYWSGGPSACVFDPRKAEIRCLGKDMLFQVVEGMVSALGTFTMLCAHHVVLPPPLLLTDQPWGDIEAARKRKAERESRESRRILAEKRTLSLMKFAVETDFTTPRQYYAAKCLVSVERIHGKLVATCKGAKAKVSIHMEKSGAIVYIIHLPNRISVAAADGSSRLREIGYATHEHEVDESGGFKMSVRRLGYISINEPFRGTKLGNLILFHLANTACQNGEPIMRVGHPDPTLNEIFWKPAGYDIDGAKVYFYYWMRRSPIATRPWAGGEGDPWLPPPKETDLAEIKVPEADGFAGAMLKINKLSSDLCWMEVYDDGATSRRCNGIAFSIGTYNRCLEIAPAANKTAALEKAGELFAPRGFELVCDPSALSSDDLAALALGKGAGDLIVLFGKEHPSSSRNAPQFSIFHATCLTDDGGWASKLGKHGPLVFHTHLGAVAGIVGCQPIALYGRRTLAKRWFALESDGPRGEIELCQRLIILWKEEDGIYKEASKCILSADDLADPAKDAKCTLMCKKLVSICQPLQENLLKQCAAVREILALEKLRMVILLQRLFDTSGSHFRSSAISAFVSLLRKVKYKGWHQPDWAPEGMPLEYFFCGVLRQMKYEAGCKVLCALDEAMGDRELEIIGVLGDVTAQCQYEEGVSAGGNFFLFNSSGTSKKPSGSYPKMQRGQFAKEFMLSFGKLGSPNPSAALIHHLELTIDMTAAVHSLFVGIEEGTWSSTIKVYLSPHYISTYHEQCHLVRMLRGYTGPKEIPADLLPFQVLESYDELEEYLNIFADPELSERALLEEMGYPIRLGHHGFNIHLKTGNTQVDERMEMMQPPMTLRECVLKARLEIGKISKEEYEALRKKPSRK